MDLNTQNNLDFGTETPQASDEDALTIKSANLITIRLVLNTANIDDLLNCLDATMHDSDGYFDGEPVIIDANGLESDIDWKLLVQAIKDHNLQPAGFDAVGNNIKLAKKIGLAQLDLTAPVRSNPRRISAEKNTTEKNVSDNQIAQENPADTDIQPIAQNVSNQNIATKIIERPLRSGQRIYAAGGDLIVIGMVSQGAEVIADGNIHIYGPLRGKAMAGAAGNTQAKIFTTQLEPELLAIAGVFKVFESPKDNPVHNQNAIVQLNNNSLEIKGL